MQKQNQPISCSLPPSNQTSKKPSMASQQGAAPPGRSGGADGVRSHTDAENDLVSPAPEDFEFCILSSGGLALAGEDAAGMCAADEVFSGGKLLPFRLSSATSADASSALLLLRSDSLDGAATAASTSSFSSRSVSRSASSSSSSSCVSRSASFKSASSDPASVASCPPPPPRSKGAFPADAAVPPRRRSLSSSVFYAHPSPSPRPPRRSARPAAATSARRSTGSAPPASWGVIRLGVVGAPEVYAPRPAGARGGGSRSARFDQPRTAAKEDKKLALGLLGAGLVCSCSPDAVAPVGSAEVAAAEARRRRKKAEEKKRAAKQSGQSTARRSRILEWLEDLSISKEKSVV